jgi:hypothetical protein
MKTIIFLIALFCSLSFGQGWNSTVTTTINEPNLEKMDLAANASGVHVLIKRSNGNIVYYNLNSNGVVDASKTATLQTNGDFPNIVASNNVVYALYKTGNVIRARYSTNGGSSWIWNSSLDRTTTSNLCNGVDAVYQDQLGVHLVWATQDADPYFKTYYSRLRPSDYQWVEFQDVTNHQSAPVGGFPSVTFSEGRVHVSFNSGYETNPIYNQGVPYTRDKNGSWQTPQEVNDIANLEKVHASGNNLFNFYTKFHPGIFVSLNVKIRSVSGTSWPSNSTTLNGSIMPGTKAGINNTYDGKVHAIYSNEFNLLYRNYNGSTWSGEFSIGSGYITYFALHSISNDLFTAWKMFSDNYLRYRQYDAAPLAPTGLTITKSANNHPYLQWNANNEPDLYQYIVEKLSGELTWVALTQTANRFYEDLSESYCTAVPPLQCDAGHMVYYRLKAVDVQSHISNPSGIVGTYVTGGAPYKIGEEGINREIPGEYSLAQNYPNPFNPATKINYSLPDDAKVTIKVYDMLGTEVAELVNETKPAGYYEITFDASKLSSGVYVYRIIALKGETMLFSESKRMILLK